MDRARSFSENQQNEPPVTTAQAPVSGAMGRVVTSMKAITTVALIRWWFDSLLIFIAALPSCGAPSNKRRIRDIHCNVWRGKLRRLPQVSLSRTNRQHDGS